MWSILLVTLPTQPNAVRLRIWRALKALGCVALRDGAYLLPAEHDQPLAQLAAEVREHGGSAQLMSLSPKDDAQKQDILAQFDRTPAYADWHQTLRAAAGELPAFGETEARRRVRAVAEALQNLHRIDYYPGLAALQAQSDMAQLRAELDRRFSAGEPVATAGAIARLNPAKFQGKRWATRARPWVDRLACAWLIARFIDKTPHFIWLDDPANAPKGALGFDFDGARFTHVANRVSFEVLMASFGLEADTGLTQIARVVHYLDAGGIPVEQAAGLEAVLGGLREVHADDDALVSATGAVFDALYANALRATPTGNT